MGKFAFMVHPLDVSDVSRKFPMARKLPSAIVENIVRFMPPFKTSSITGIRSPFGEAEGWFVACPLTTKQMQRLPVEFVLNRIIKTGKLAERLGAGILGLGAMTSVVGDAGVTVARNLGLAVTTGNSLTVATALEGTKRAAELMGYDLKKCEVVVIGATGSIGSVCARLLARDAKHLTLVARQEERLRELAGRIKIETGREANITSNIRQSLKQADIVVTVTSAVDTVIEPEDLKPGAVVCDVARPRDVSKRVADLRDDVLIIEGGLVEVPGEVNFNFNFGYPEKIALACMAETMVLALEERYENFTLGRDLTLEQVEEIGLLARKHGFKLAGFRSFERPITESQIELVRQRALEKRRSA